MQSVSSRIWTRVAVSISYDDNDYTTGTSYYLNIIAGVLQGDTLAPYLFIICLDYVLRTSIDKMKENGFKLTKEKCSRYSAKTITTPITPMI